jgi:hypothetical protein
MARSTSLPSITQHCHLSCSHLSWMLWPSLCRTSNRKILRLMRTTPSMSMHRDSPLCNPGHCRQRGQRGQGIPKPRNLL